MSTNDGGPAFARTLSKEEREAFVIRHQADPGYAQPGMTLRDYFAAKAMAVMYVDADTLSDWRVDEAGEPTFAQYVAQCAYELADAMLAQRDKERA